MCSAYDLKNQLHVYFMDRIGSSESSEQAGSDQSVLGLSNKSGKEIGKRQKELPSHCLTTLTGLETEHPDGFVSYEDVARLILIDPGH